MKLFYLFLAFIIIISVNSNQLYAQDLGSKEIEAKLGGNTAEHGFSVKDNEDNTMFRAGGDGTTEIRGGLKIGTENLFISGIYEINNVLDEVRKRIILPEGWTEENTRVLTYDAYFSTLDFKWWAVDIPKFQIVHDLSADTYYIQLRNDYATNYQIRILLLKVNSSN